MAQLNPSPNPTQDPNYLGYSKVPEPNLAIKEMLDGMGTLFGQAVQGADLIVKKAIDTEIHGNVRNEQEGMITSLELTKAARRAKGTSPSMGDGSGGGDTEVDESELPAEFSSQMKTVENLAAASKRGLNQTYYAARLDAIASDLKQRMPGYASYIDERVNAAIGGTAGAYIRNLIQDINESSQSERRQMDQMINFVKSKSKLPDAHIAMQNVISGKWKLPDAVEWANRWESDEYMSERRKRAREEKKGNWEIDAEETKRDFSTEISTTTDNLFSTIISSAGIKNPAELRQLVLDVQSGKRPAPSTEQALQLGQQLQAFRSQAFELLRKRAYEGGKDSYAAKMRLKPQELNEYINSHLVLYDELGKAISTKDYSLAAITANKIAAINEDTRSGLLSNPDPVIRTHTRHVAAVKELFGPEYAGKLFQHFLGQNIDNRFRDYIKDKQLELVTQNDWRTSGVPPMTPKKAVEEIRQRVRDKAGPAAAADPRNYRAVVDVVNLITDNQVPDSAKVTVMQGAFDPGNKGFVSLFQKDGRDPETGRPVIGMYAAFKQFSAPKITEEVLRLDKTNPGLAKKYFDWLDHTFGKELFGREIQDLNNLQQFKNIEVKYDPINTRFYVNAVPPKGAAGSPAERAAERTASAYQNRPLRSAQEMLDRVNDGLTTLAPAIRAAGGDPEAYLLSLLLGAGYRPGDGKDGTVPALLMRELAQHRVKNAIKNKEMTPLQQDQGAGPAPQE